MRSISELTHYEVLEISREADLAEVERAYRLARATYDESSIAAYSLYEDREAEQIRERVDLAYRVLSEPDTRQEYDRSLGADEEGVEISFTPAERVTPAEVPPALAPLDVFEEGEDAPFDGPRLRRSRLHRGIELERIAEVTKINPTYLRFLEEERFDGLPAPVYVRGFVCAYARCLGLDPDRVAPSYMERFEEARLAACSVRGRR